MNKKSISGILLGSLLTISMSAIAVSCHVEPTVSEKKPGTKPMVPEKKPMNPEMKPTTPDKKPMTPEMKPTTPDKKPMTPDKPTTPEMKPTTPEVDPGKTKISTENLNAELNKVTIEYPKKEEVLASEAAKENFKFLGYDDKKFKILVISVTPNDEKFNTLINFKIVDINFDDNQSDEKEITISGFKNPTTDKLKKIAEKIQVDYSEKEKIYPWEANSVNITFSDFDSDIIASDYKVTGLNPDNLNVIITFTISDKDNPEIKINHSVEVSGFKTLSKDHSNLTKILFNDNKGLIKLDKDYSKTLSLYKELAKTEAQLEINFSSDKIVIPASNKSIDFAKAETFVEVGTLTSVYKNVHNDLLLEVTKLINETLKVNDTSLWENIAKLFTLSKEEAIKQFENEKLRFESAKTTLSTHVNFISDFEENIKKLLEKDNFSIVYNLKTGSFVMQKGEAEIDLNKSETFTEFIGFQKSFNDDIINKIKEVFKKHEIEEGFIDLFFNDKTNAGYTIKKNEKSLITGLTIKQINVMPTKPKPPRRKLPSFDPL